MAKRKSVSTGLNRKQIARREKEAKAQQTLVWAAIAVAVVVVGVLGYGLVTELIIKASKPVASIDGETIATRDYQRRLYYERLLMRQQLVMYQNYLYQLDANDPNMQEFYQQIQYSAATLENQLDTNMSAMLGKQVLDSVIEETFILEEASVQGLTASEDEITLGIEEMLGYDRAAMETMTDTTDMPSFDELYTDFRDRILKPSRLSEDEYRTIMQANVLREKLRTAISDDVELTADQVETVFLATDNEEGAAAFQQRITEGEPAESVLEELNSDESDATGGYTLPWLPVGYLSSQLGEEIEKVAFNTPVGRASQPILGDDGKYYVIYVTGHEERELSDALVDQAREEKYIQWLEAQQQARVEYLEWQDAVLTEP